MKILHVIHSVDPRGGGPIEGVRQLVPALAAQGVTTEVMSLDAPDAPGTSDFPVPLHALGPSRFGYGYNSRAVPWLKKNRKAYDAVIVNGLWQYSGFAAWRALHKTSTPYYVYPHGMLDPWFKRQYPLKHLKKWLYWPWGEYRVLRDAAAVLFTCEQESLLARQSFGLYQCREEITGYGIASPPGDAARQRELFLEHYPELKGKQVVLFLGRVHEKKGCDLLLQAWKEIVSQAEPQIHLVMAGPADHAYGSEMKLLAQKLGLGASLTWPGMLTGDLKWGCLRSADAFILPSHQENFGISVVEALACGVPVLISDKVNIWREIENDQAGFVENDDLRGTIQLLKRWLKLSPDKREIMKTYARQCFEMRFTISKTAQALTSLLTH
jgi:glycosyltransferase involved in cell wall biosynthesis